MKGVAGGRVVVILTLGRIQNGVVIVGENPSWRSVFKAVRENLSTRKI